MTTLFWGGTAVLLDSFDPGRSLEAIERHKVTILGQIPAMYHYLWRHPQFDPRRLESLQVAIYGGQQVARPFLERLAALAARVGTGLGLTEAAGFCTYTPPAATVDAIAESLGFDMPVYRMTVRAPMNPDGTAGRELPDGEIGQICFQGPQTFLGYAGDPESTAAAVSRDGILYTGDLGCRTPDGLHFSGRAKWVIKPAGHQVFPGDVENHFCQMDNVAHCAVVGVPHPLLSEAIVAFIEPKSQSPVTAEELRRHARAIASYMSPLHYVILAPGQMPFNRAAKPDYLQLKHWAETEAQALGWIRRGR
jgi:acyl-CoA synthetase (AMP-forming)/AMP-acid ligase II